MNTFLKGSFILFTTAVLALVCLIAFLWAEHYVSLTLPAPSGPFAVSRVLEMWTDDRRPDPLPEAGGKRTELVVWFWYPSDRSVTQPPADYLPADWTREALRGQTRLGMVFSALASRGTVYPHSMQDGAVASRQARYPVVILRPGLGALTIQQTTLAEDLASHGYVVVGFDAPYRTGIVVFPDGRVVTRPASLNPETLTSEDARRDLATKLMHAWVSDIGFVVDRLQQVDASASGRFGGRLDMQKVGIVGHSLGGASAAQFCHDDARCRAGVDIDGLLLGSVVREGLPRPFMFLLSDHGDTKDPADRRIADDIRSVYDRLPRDTRLALVVRGAHHFSFSDDLITKTHLVRWGLRLAAGVTLDPRRGLAIGTDTVRRFLDVHLKGAPAESLQGLQTTYPELQATRP